MPVPRSVQALTAALAILIATVSAASDPSQEESFGEAVTVSTVAGTDLELPAPGNAATVLLFLSTDCPIANKYAPELRRIQKQFADRGVTFLRVYGARYHDAEDVTKHTEDYKYTMPAILDADQALALRTGATVTPEAVVLNEAGDIVYRGRIDDRYVDFGRYRQHAKQHDLIDALTATLAGKPPPNPRTKAIGCFIAPPREDGDAGE
jgi:protein-disulfide isomerase